MSHFTIDSLRESMEKIGQIYPVIKDENGTILDGYHRKRVDPDWKEVTIPISDELESLRIRVHLNDLRRSIPSEEKQEWIKLARELLQKRGFKGTQKEIAAALGLTQAWVSKYDENPIQPNEPHKVQRRYTFSNYNVLGIKSPDRLVDDLKSHIIEAFPKEIRKEVEKPLNSALIQVADKINPFFFVERGDPEQPDKDFYHGATPAFIIENLVRKYEPSRVLDSMAGTGTTGYVCSKYGIGCDQYDLYPYEKFGVKKGDAEFVESDYLYDLVFNHIPYMGMVNYGKDDSDLSNLKEEKYFAKLEGIFKTNYGLLNEDGIYAVLVGDWRSGGQLKPITAKTTLLGLDIGFELWDSAVKLTGEMKSKALQEWRAEKFGYYAQMYDTLLIFRR